MVPYLWAINFAAQLLLLAILIIRRHYRQLPFFTTYIALNISQAVLLFFAYRHFGADSNKAYVLAWGSEAITLVARLCATAEVLYWVIMSYRGIWNLAWRLLLVGSLLVLISVSLASRGDATWALMRADRGYHMLFAVVLIAFLALIRYYFIPVDPLFKALLVSFCFYSCFKILLNTVVQTLLYPRLSQYASIWQVLGMALYLVVVIWWAFALARPFPAIQTNRVMLPANVYQRISPEIHAQLHAMNLQLVNFWEKQEPEH